MFMGAISQSRVLAGAALATACIVASSCAVNSSARQQPYRTFFLPPSPAPVPVYQPIADPPVLSAGVYANEAPNFAASLAPIPRSSDTDFILRRAEEHFAAGKKAVEDGRYEDARTEFNKAIEILLNAPDDTSERAKLEKRLEDMVDAIYRYDTGELGAGEQTADAAQPDARPIDQLVDMTFPVDPSLRSKVQEQIRATASQLPLEESDAVISYINYFSSPKGKKILEAGLRRSGRYKSMIERILAEEGLPRELIFLAQAESGFIPKAVSNKLCVGLWQFIKYRGEEYGLNVTSAVDDRMDPEKATRAAAKHLHDLYTHLGDWYLAMAAYDCGPGCIDHAVQRTGYADFWTLRRLNVLPKETANYVPVILAMIIVSKNAKDYGLDDIEPDSPVEYETVELDSPTSLSLVASAVDRPLADLKDLNPALLKPIAPAGYQLRIPLGSRETLDEAFAAVPANERDSWRVHRVEAGDTPASLAKRYGTTASLVESANRGDFPEAGAFAAVPVGYPGDHPVVKRANPGRVSHARTSAAKRGTVSSVRKPAVAQASKRTATRKTAGAAHAPGV